MDAFVKALERQPWLLLTLVVLLAGFAVMLVIAFLQGREISLWPPKIGARPVPDVSRQSTGQLPSEAIGITRYERDSHALDDVKAQGLRQARTEIWLIGATMHYTLSNCQQVLIDRVLEGVNINIFVADPLGRDFEATARSFGQKRGALNAESLMTLTACRDMLQVIAQARIVRGALNVRLLDRVFTAGAYFFDPKTDRASMIFVPHVVGNDAPVAPGFLAKTSKSGLLTHYFELYSAAWNKGVRYEEWISQHHDYLDDSQS